MAFNDFRIAAGIPLLLMAGCATYQEPTGPAAELILSSNLGQDPFTRAGEGVGLNGFVAFGDSACEVPLGHLGGFKMGLFDADQGASRTVRIQAATRLYVRADWEHAVGVGNQTEARRTCYNFVSFVPEAGERYEIRQTVTQGSLNRPDCAAAVRKQGESAVVKSLEQHSLTGKCAAYVWGPGAR